MTFVRYGIPFKKTFSHVESAVDDKNNVSAEANGVKIVSNERKKIKSAYVIVFRFKEFDQQDQENHKKNAKKHIGKGYAYARYILDTIRIVSFVIIIFGWILALISVWIEIALATFIVFVTLFEGYIKEKDKLTEDCAETQSLIYSEDGRWISLPKPRNEFPNGMVQVWENLILNGIAEVIAEKEKGGDWNWSHKE